MSPGLRSSTCCASTAATRNVTRRSAPTSGETTGRGAGVAGGPGGACAAETIEVPTTAEHSQAARRSDEACGWLMAGLPYTRARKGGFVIIWESQQRRSAPAETGLSMTVSARLLVLACLLPI